MGSSFFVARSRSRGLDLCALTNSPDCKRQLSRRHLLADSGIDLMVNEEYLLSDSL